MSLLKPLLRPQLNCLFNNPLPSTTRNVSKSKLRKTLPDWLADRMGRKSAEFLAAQKADPSIPPYRQIRLAYDDDTVTVYQAYSSEMAQEALKKQKLDASRKFVYSRRAFLKCSFSWMLWRTGYTLTDPLQSHILALKLARPYFDALLDPPQLHLNQAYLPFTQASAKHHTPTRAQWDIERNIHAEKCLHRTLVLSLDRLEVKRRFLTPGHILEIVDETERARDIKRLLDEGKVEEAKARMPVEREYPVPNEIYHALGMGYTSG